MANTAAIKVYKIYKKTKKIEKKDTLYLNKLHRNQQKDCLGVFCVAR